MFLGGGILHEHVFAICCTHGFIEPGRRAKNVKIRFGGLFFNMYIDIYVYRTDMIYTYVFTQKTNIVVSYMFKVFLFADFLDALRWLARVQPTEGTPRTCWRTSVGWLVFQPSEGKTRTCSRTSACWPVFLQAEGAI